MPLSERLARSVGQTRLPPGLAGLLGIAAALGAAGLRLTLGRWFEDTAALSTFYPALLAAAVWGGRLAAGAAFLSAIALARLLVGGAAAADGPLVGFIIFSGLTVALGLLLRGMIRELTRSWETQAMLARELRHRVKNNLAVIKALAFQTGRNSPDLAVFLAAFSERLSALSGAQDLVVAADADGVDLAALVRTALAPFVAKGSQLSLAGPAAAVSPDQAVSLALCLNELATNASKYGALSQPGGVVSISWREAGRGELEAEWSERGGPEILVPPDRAGLGSRLLERGVAGRRAALEYRASGVRWRARLSAAVAPASAPAGQRRRQPSSCSSTSAIS